MPLIKIITLISLMLTVTFAHAADPLSYNYLQLSYIDIDGADFDADGLALSGSALLSDQIYTTASFARVETDRFTNAQNEHGSVQADSIAFALGFRQPLAEGTDLNIEAAFLRGKLKPKGEFNGQSDSDSGHGVALRLRHLVNQRFELNFNGEYQDIFDESDTSVGVAALVHVTSRFTAGMGYSLSSDEDVFTIGVRMSL